MAAETPTDFFDRQERAKRQTAILAGLFTAAVVGIIASVYIVAMLLFVVANRRQTDGRGVRQVEPASLWNPSVFAGVAGATSLLVAGGSLSKIASLRAGGEVVALELGGRLINPQSRDPVERRLLNIVEEMALASGLPVPPVYIMEQEEGINAFAAGNNAGDAVIGVTRGALNYLNRDELQGVIGHEFSHILNGDMKLNLQLMGVLAGILLLSTLGWLLFRSASQWGWSYSSRSNDREEKRGDGRMVVILFGLALVVIGWIGVFFGRLIKAAIARERERLADASSVEFTRNPQGLADALKKIGGIEGGSLIRSPRAEEASHMFFGDGVPMFLELLATHPPLVERIRQLDPTFDGVFPQVRPLATTQQDVESELDDADPRKKPQKEARDRLRDAIGMRLPGMPQAAPGSRIPFDPLTTIATIGTAGSQHISYAQELMRSIPPDLSAAARDTYGAQAAIFCLLLDPDQSLRQDQLRWLQRRVEPGLWQATLKLMPAVARLAQEARVPLVNLAIPALRSLTQAQYLTFRDNVDSLIAADQRVDLFEFSLRRMLIRHLDRAFIRQEQTKEMQSREMLAKASAVLLSRLAWEGQPGDASRAAAAFKVGWSTLRELDPPGTFQILPEQDCDYSTLDSALDVLARVPPKAKERVLSACAQTIAADGAITISEGELLRTVADALDCPMPPLLADEGKLGAASPASALA